MNFLAAGWKDYEDFEAWFDLLVERHPRRNGENFAKTYLMTRVVDGKYQHRNVELRKWIEDCHAAYCQSADWRKGFATTLFCWLRDETWMRYPAGFAPPSSKKTDCTCSKCNGLGTTDCEWVSMEELRKMPSITLCECEAGRMVKELLA